MIEPVPDGKDSEPNWGLLYNDNVNVGKSAWNSQSLVGELNRSDFRVRGRVTKQVHLYLPVEKKKEAHMDEELTGSTQVNGCKELDDVPGGAERNTEVHQ